MCSSDLTAVIARQLELDWQYVEHVPAWNTERIAQIRAAGRRAGRLRGHAAAWTPYPARAARWISVSWATVERRAYPTSGPGRAWSAAVAAASVSVTSPSYGEGLLN